MRIDFSRPIPGLLMALPLIAILLSVSRVPISATQPLSRAREAAIETNRHRRHRVRAGHRWTNRPSDVRAA